MIVNTSQNDTGVIKGEFKSCRLVREGDSGSVYSTTELIPVKFAVSGKKLELLEDDKWITWMVLSASAHVVVDPVDSRVLIKSHRKATGDSMPKSKNKE